MLRTSISLACLALCACSSAPRAIEVEIDNQLGTEVGSGATSLTAHEIFSGFPQVSGWTTASWQAPPGRSVHKMEACLPVHIAGLELTPDNADLQDADRTLHYRIELRPMPEAGALRAPKQKGAPGISFFTTAQLEADTTHAASNAADFAAAVAHAGGRAALGCWGSHIFEAMDRAKR